MGGVEERERGCSRVFFWWEKRSVRGRGRKREF